MTTVKICIDVADLDEASAFYCQALQCSEVGRNPRTVRLTAGGSEIYLMLRSEGSMPFLAATEGRSFARHWTPVHLDFSVGDVAPSTWEIAGLGGIVEGQESGDWGSLTRCVDPFGNGFCLVATFQPPRGGALRRDGGCRHRSERPCRIETSAISATGCSTGLAVAMRDTE